MGREERVGGCGKEAVQQWARRENKKGRAIGGMIMGVRKGFEMGGGTEGIMAKKVKIGGRER